MAPIAWASRSPLAAARSSAWGSDSDGDWSSQAAPAPDWATGNDGPAQPCEAVGAELDWATPSRDDDERFELTGPGWIAGDSTYSVRLPDERTLWLFSDSFIGEVSSSGRPAPGMAMVHNALVAESESGRLSTRTSAGPESFFPDPSDDSYYWVQDAVVQGDELVVVRRTLCLGGRESDPRLAHGSIDRVQHTGQLLRDPRRRRPLVPRARGPERHRPRRGHRRSADARSRRRA